MKCDFSLVSPNKCLVHCEFGSEFQVFFIEAKHTVPYRDKDLIMENFFNLFWMIERFEHGVVKLRKYWYDDLHSVFYFDVFLCSLPENYVLFKKICEDKLTQIVSSIWNETFSIDVKIREDESKKENHGFFQPEFYDELESWKKK